jgi:hypothetical protein
MTGSPPLHVGWLLDVLPKSMVPVTLNASGLKSHTAIIAQSGSGKSFMLGRLLEEIAGKTRARILILDPNSDFVKFSEVDPSAWQKEPAKQWLGPDDLLEPSEKRWAQLGFRVLTNRPPGSLSLKHPRARIGCISVSWSPLPVFDQGAHLGCSPHSNPEELLALASMRGEEAEHLRLMGVPLNLQGFRDLLSQFLHAAKYGIFTTSNEWPMPSMVRMREHIQPEVALRLLVRMEDLLSLGIWDRDNPDNSVGACVDRLSEPDRHDRVLCIDLGSPDKPAAWLAAASAALNGLWYSARKYWLEAMNRSPEDDPRVPVFIVIDEAHNLAPTQPPTDLARSLNEILVRIATEGRKYGLFLVLITQRPHRLDQTILSQCDNLCLLKMNNRMDLDLVESSFGFIPQHWAQRALDFSVGDALLAGNFVDRPVCIHAASRRTAEGGRNLQDTFWLQDPLDM